MYGMYLYALHVLDWMNCMYCMSVLYVLHVLHELDALTVCIVRSMTLLVEEKQRSIGANFKVTGQHHVPHH